MAEAIEKALRRLRLRKAARTKARALVKMLILCGMIR